MGGLCSCLLVPDDVEDYNSETSLDGTSMYEKCLQWASSIYSACFNPGEWRAESPPNRWSGSQEAILRYTSSLNMSSPDTFRPPPMPLPYDINPKCFDEDTDMCASTKGMEQNESKLSPTDVEVSCPICLDEYTEDNPKIIPQNCDHDFHLGCILEWMERSEGCPLCEVEMVLSETS